MGLITGKPTSPTSACLSCLQFFVQRSGRAFFLEAWQHAYCCCSSSGPFQAAILLRFHGCNFPVVFRRHNFTADFWSSGSEDLSVPLLQCFVNLRCSAYVIDVLVGAGCPMITYSLRFNWLWFPVWSPLKAVLICDYKDVLWECFRNYTGLGEQRQYVLL